MNEESGGSYEDFQLMVMEYHQTFNHDEWKASREMADEMMETIPGLSNNFQLDDVTFGDGQCFHTAVHQQLRRSEVQSSLPSKYKKLSRNSDMKAFKSTIRRFMINNKHPVVKALRDDFQIFMDGMTWDEYWSSKNLFKKEFWADEVFVRATAWFLKLDIVIHQNVPGQPEKMISGNIDNDTISFQK